jgi:hypothetical protein
VRGSVLLRDGLIGMIFFRGSFRSSVAVAAAAIMLNQVNTIFMIILGILLLKRII